MSLLQYICLRIELDFCGVDQVLLIYVLNYAFTFSLSYSRKKLQSCERKLAYVFKCQDLERLEETQMKKFLQLHE